LRALRPRVHSPKNRAREQLLLIQAGSNISNNCSLEPIFRQGVETLEKVKSYLNTYLEKYTEKRSKDLTTVKVETIPDLEKEPAKTISERKTKYPLFYEIPK
jgi:hypothetical protein